MAVEDPRDQEIAKLKAQLQATPAAKKPGNPIWKFFRIALIVVGGLFVLLVVVSMFSKGGSSNSSSSAAVSGAQATAAQAPGIGQSIDGDGWRLTVTGVSTPSQVGTEIDMEKPSQGGTLVAVDFTVQNTSDKPLSSSDVPKLVLVDPSGNAYEEDAGKTLAYQVEKPVDNKAWSDLNPGITEHNSTVFEVSADKFDRGTWSLAIGDASGQKISIVGK